MDFHKVADIRTKPVLETDFKIPANKYYREILQCNNCGVFLNNHKLISEGFYESAYNENTYKRRLASSFQKITALPIEQSDNKQRCSRIHAFLNSKGYVPGKTRILDVGSGLCVFLAEMKKYGYFCACLDPDAVAVAHSIEKAEVDAAFSGTLFDFNARDGFDLITLNKVLEHLPNPIETLLRAKNFLKSDGIIYIELPDGDIALRQGEISSRQEFFIEHLAIYNPKSMQKLLEITGLKVIKMEQIIEPSGKATIYSFTRVS
jgi:2-polyprenyl-3-methyl-5-hydroxy-6-metoxy-1,4-benzoquinol methylase